MQELLLENNDIKLHSIEVTDKAETVANMATLLINLMHPQITLHQQN